MSNMRCVDSLASILTLAVALGLLASPVIFLINLICAAVFSDNRSYYLGRAGLSVLVGAGLFVVYFGVLGGGRQVRARGQGQLTACKSNLKNLATSLEMYATDNQGHYPNSLAALTPNYHRTIPQCPTAGTDTYGSSYTCYRPSPQASATPGNSTEGYTIFCQGQHHQKVQMAPNYPQFSSFSGLILP